jgi:hypothetical protein
MTCSPVAVNTKIDFIVLLTISFRVARSAQVSLIGSLAWIAWNAVMVNDYPNL